MRLLSRTILALMLASAAALLIFGPRPNPHLQYRDGSPVPPNVTRIAYWEKWGGNEARQMNEIVDDVNHPVGREKKIFVQYLSISTVDKKTLTATAAGVPPDVAGLWDRQLTQFAAEDALEPLDNLAAEHGITPDLYKPVYWKSCTYNGRLWGLVSTPYAYALHYNKWHFWAAADRLRAAGLDPTRPPATLQDLDHYAKVLDLRDPGTGHIERAGYLPMEPGWTIAVTAYWFGGNIFDEKTNKFTLTSPQNIAAFNWVRSYTLKLGDAAMSQFSGRFGELFNTPNNPFLTGQVSMVCQGPWMANYIYDLKPSMSEALVPYCLERYLPRVARPFNYKWDVAPFPSAVPGLNGVTYDSFDVLVIPRGSHHKREAFEFLAYVNRQDVQEKLCSMHCKNSVLASYSRDYIRTNPNPYIEMFEKLAASPNARGTPTVPIYPLAEDEIKQAAQTAALQLDVPVEQCLQETQDRLTQKLDQFLDGQRRRVAAR